MRAAGRRRQRRGAGDLRRRVDGRLRHRARRLGQQLEVLAARRPAQLGADDQLRARLRHGAGDGRDVWRTRCRSARSSTRSRATFRRFGFIPKWYIFPQFIGFFVFACAGVAETNRAPFDFPEAEQELVAGYHTEYSSMRFAMFFMAEYINMVTVSAVATNLYLGGWHGPFIPASYGWIWFVIKLAFLLFVYLWLRWTLPRFRYDQLMSFGWKVLLPLATRQPDRSRPRGCSTLASDALLFYAFAAVTVIGSLVVVSQKNPVYSLLSLVGAFFGLCRPLRAARSAVPRGGADHRLRRRDHGAVPVRGDGAERAARGCRGVGSRASAVPADGRARRRRAGGAARARARLGAVAHHRPRGAASPTAARRVVGRRSWAKCSSPTTCSRSKSRRS